MKKSVAMLSVVGVLLSNMAFAQAQQNHPKHNPEFHKAISECFAEAGVKKPEMPKELKDKKSANQADKATKADKANANRPEPPKDANGNPLPMPQNTSTASTPSLK